jgi:hypothetical protein
VPFIKLSSNVELIPIDKEKIREKEFEDVPSINNKKPSAKGGLKLTTKKKNEDDD